MKTKQLIFVVVVFFVLLLQGNLVIAGEKPGGKVNKSPASQFHGYQQGFNVKLWLGNYGMMGLKHGDSAWTPSGYGLEYPIGSGVEHLYGAGLWVGTTIDTSTSGIPHYISLVSSAYESRGGHEMSGNPDRRDSFYFASIDNSNGHSQRFTDDDGDGNIDEDELDGIDNDLDGEIDEDYGAVSESDVYVAYHDTASVEKHIPIGIKVWQRSFAWKKRVPEPVLPIEFYVMNIGTKVLNNVFLGFFADPDVGPSAVNDYAKHNNASAYYDLYSINTFNNIDSPSTPIGVTLLGSSKPLDSLRFRINAVLGSEFPANDAGRYGIMTDAILWSDWPFPPYDFHCLVSCGPFDNFRPGDTLKLVVAFVVAENTGIGPGNLRDKILRAQSIYRRKFTTHPIPSSPPLHVIKEKNKVILDWKWKPGDQGTDPLETWDDMDDFVDSLHPLHWRKKNSPPGHSRGGRVFEAFRIWRSESPTFRPNTFGLLKQFDIADDLQLEEQTGIQFTLVDSGFNPERPYWYAVTSRTIPELARSIRPNLIGGMDTVNAELTPSLESAIEENATFVPISNNYQLYPSYPNPFNPKATIGYYLPEAGRVVLNVYDVLGREVAKLVDEFKPAGRYDAEWNAGGLASGVYFYQITAGGFQDVKKAVLIR